MWPAGGRPERGLTHLHRDTLVHAPLDDTFAFFADASNLQRLTPPWLQFSIRTRMPVVMRAGLEIDYRIRLYGVPLPWRSRIDAWEPGVRFVDRQIAGPYLWWRHEHRFEPAGDATRVIDDVEYLPRARWLTGRLVRRDVARIFRYREEALRRIFDHDGAGKRAGVSAGVSSYHPLTAAAAFRAIGEGEPGDAPPHGCREDARR